MFKFLVLVLKSYLIFVLFLEEVRNFFVRLLDVVLYVGYWGIAAGVAHLVIDFCLFVFEYILCPLSRCFRPLEFLWSKFFRRFVIVVLYC